jgi:hypothetical protein
VIAKLGEPCTSRQQVVDAIDRVAYLIDELPRWDGYQCAPETDLELRAAAALLERVELYLRPAAAREAPRVEALETEFRARGELPPWRRKALRRAEDAD